MFEIHGIAIICLSVAVNILLLPLYNVAEKWQQRERDIQARLKNKLDDIKAVFKGAERHMIIRTYYRQNHYHPFYSLRSVLGLAIQIPFFIAAYHFLSHMPMSAKTSSWYFIKDLMSPDALLTVSGITINLLPIVMTVINLVSAFVYSGKLQKKEKNQLFIMAFLFLVLLYNSPSGLVLYWTMNNLISLIKNLINLTKNPKKYFYITLTGFLAFMFGYSLLLRYPLFMRLADLGNFVFKSKKMFLTNMVLGSFFAFVLLFPLFSRYIHKGVKNIFSGLDETAGRDGTVVFALSCAILFMLTGLVAPSFLISGSPLEFTEIISGSYYNPSWAIAKSALQAFSLFIFVPSVIFILFSRDVKKYLILFSFIFALASLVNIFIFSGSYGVISLEFTFDNSLILKPERLLVILNSLGLIIVSAAAVFLIKKNYYKFINNILIIIVISLFSISLFNVYKINSEFNEMLAYKSNMDAETEGQKSGQVFNFSKTGKNVFIVMLDRALGGLMGEVLNHNPELAQQMPGFIWYRNTLSFNGHTLLGAPPLFGGYEYTPKEMNKREDETLTDKHNEALLVMPRLFLENDYKVVVTDPRNTNDNWASDLTIYEKYPGIYADDLIGKYSSEWINENIKNNHEIPAVNIKSILNEYLLSFSIFRIMPNFTRSRLYDNSRWMKPDKANLPLKFINSFSVLDYLPKLVRLDSDKDTFNITTNDTVH
ncbi:MAG: membrane protein insertase YidC, partial [Spirochaetia bacterium]|nr:membrane protein insertase YidC [Spirochaetia bacterium]